MKTAATSARAKPVAGRVEQPYRLYRIIAGNLGGTCKAIAYLGIGGTPAVETVEAASVEDAVAQMKQMLDVRLAAMRQERRADVPTAAEFRESLAALPANVREGIRALNIDRLDPRSSGSAIAALSLRTKTDAATISNDLRKTARKLGELLEPEAAGGEQGSDPLGLLASMDVTDGAGVPAPRFHAEFIEALASLPPERTATTVSRR